MNKFIVMGRLTKDPEVRYGGANNICIARFSLAVDRRFKRDGEPTADFFNMTALGKQGEFVEKYLHKGTKIVCDCEVRNNNYTNKEGQKVYGFEFVTNSIEFAESKSAQNNNYNAGGQAAAPTPNEPLGDDFLAMGDVEEDLPFN